LPLFRSQDKWMIRLKEQKIHPPCADPHQTYPSSSKS